METTPNSLASLPELCTICSHPFQPSNLTFGASSTNTYYLFSASSSHPLNQVFSSLTNADPPQVCFIFTVVYCSMPVSFPQNDYYLKNKGRNYAFYFCILYSNEHKTVLGKRQTLNISVICHMGNVQMVPAQDKGRKGTWKNKTLFIC